MGSDGTLVLRDMVPGEEKALVGSARKAFKHSPMEQIAISTPSKALVVEIDGNIAGAMFLKVYGKGEKRIGYLDVGFVVKAFRGQGVGRALYPAAVERLRDMGSETICAQVIDDNVASWKPLQNAGFGAPSFTELTRLVGLGNAVSIWLRTFNSIASGARLWVSGAVKKSSGAQELATFLLANLLLILPGLFLQGRSGEQIVYALLALPVVLLAGAIFGGIGCLVARERWRFEFIRGGALLAFLCGSVGGVFPMVGRWYPQSPEPTKACRQAMGIQATVEWAGMIAFYALCLFLLPEVLFFHKCAAFMANLLIYRLIPFMPFGSFGGGRVWAWSKPVFAVLAAVSVVLLFIVFG